MFSTFARPFAALFVVYAVGLGDVGLGGLGLGAAPAQANVSIRIDLSTQRMFVTGERGERYTWPISSGRQGFVTPRGTFRPQSLRRMHFSRTYDNAPMPHSIFFHKGWAIHGTSAVGALGRPASHGCVRLAPRNAAKLFAMVQRDGATITITGDPPHMMNVAQRRARARVADARPAAESGAFTPVQRAPGYRGFDGWALR